MSIDENADGSNSKTEITASVSKTTGSFQPIETLIFLNHSVHSSIDWEQLNNVVIHSLKELIDPAITLHASFLSLVDAEIKWINALTFTPGKDVDYRSQAKYYRSRLSKLHLIGRCFLIDGILAELNHSITLNDELFKYFKKITILAVLAILRINAQNNVADDTAIETAIRNIRLFADNIRRSSLTTALSDIEFDACIEDIINSVHEEHEQCVQDRSLQTQLANLHQILNRLYNHRGKRDSSGDRSLEESEGYLETVSSYRFDGAQIDVISDIYSGKGRKKPDAWSEEEQLGNTRDKATYLVSQPPTKLQDFSARVLQAKSIAQSISLRTQALPCSSSILSSHQIQKVVAELLHLMNNGNVAALQLFLQLLLGMTQSELLDLPMSSKPIRKQDVEDNTCWLIYRKDKLTLQRLVKVANSNVHKRLTTLLPKTSLFIFLPLPDIVQSHWKPEFLRQDLSEEITKVLATINKNTGIHVTKTQISNFLLHWLQATHVDQAIAGILAGKSAKQCAPIAYSYIGSDFVLDIWQEYVASLGLSVVAEKTDEAIGSRLYPRLDKFAQLLGVYQAHLKSEQRFKKRLDTMVDTHNAFIRHCLLILGLSTAARPVNDMYGSRHDYCLHTRMIRISDKEIRSAEAGRMLPLTSLAIQQLKLLERHLETMVNRFHSRFPHIAQSAERALSGEGPLLFWLSEIEMEKGGMSYQIVPISPTSLDDAFDNLLPLPVNWHRHAVRSHLFYQKIPSVLIAAFMGHEDMGHEYTHTFSAASLQDLFKISRVLDHWFSSIGLGAIAGW